VKDCASRGKGRGRGFLKLSELSRVGLGKREGGKARSLSIAAGKGEVGLRWRRYRRGGRGGKRFADLLLSPEEGGRSFFQSEGRRRLMIDY